MSKFWNARGAGTAGAAAPRSGGFSGIATPPPSGGVSFASTTTTKQTQQPCSYYPPSRYSYERTRWWWCLWDCFVTAGGRQSRGNTTMTWKNQFLEFVADPVATVRALSPHIRWTGLVIVTLLTTGQVWRFVRVITAETFQSRHFDTVEELIILRETAETTTTTATTAVPLPTSMAACLLVMDDNHRLSEWIAYHYHTLPLRYLVVAVDPRSQTSPSDILQRWQDLTDLTVVQWNKDADFGFVAPNTATDNKSKKKKKKLTAAEIAVEQNTQTHAARKRTFYKACTKHLQEHNQTWTSYWDVDEYLTIHPPLSVSKTAASLIEPPVSIAQHLHQALQQQDSRQKNLNRPCSSIPRLLFGAVENGSNDISRNVPAGVDPLKFDTLRWRYHADASNRRINGPSKSLMDVSYPSVVDAVSTPTTAFDFSIYRPLSSCPPITYVDSLSSSSSSPSLVLYHYLGSWESYSARDDARRGHDRSREAWELRQHVTNVLLSSSSSDDDGIANWIQGFVTSMGHDKAVQLLQGVGEIPATLQQAAKPLDWNRLAGWVEPDVDPDQDNNMQAQGRQWSRILQMFRRSKK